MNAEKFNKDVEFYEKRLLEKYNKHETRLMLRSYCMGYCELANHLNEDFDTMLMINPVLEKITELSKKLKGE